MSYEFGPLHYSLYPLHPTVTELRKSTALRAVPKAVEKTIEQLKIIDGVGGLGNDSIQMLEAAEKWNGDLSPKKGYTSYNIDNFPFCSGELELYAFGIDGYPSIRILPTNWEMHLKDNDFKLVSDEIIKEFGLQHDHLGENYHLLYVDPVRLSWYQRGADLASTLFLKRLTEAYAISVLEDLGKLSALHNDLDSFSKLMDVRV